MLPGEPKATDLPITLLDHIGQRGLYDMNIAGKGASAPFTKAQPSPTATYPSLWNHDATRESRMLCEPDSQLVVKPGQESKAHEVWLTASRTHMNRDFRFTSQSLLVSFTEQKSIGGRAWPNVQFDPPVFEYAFTIWGNSTLGLLAFWWHANRQVSGRGTATVSAIPTLPVLDFRALSDDQLATAEDIFNDSATGS